MSTVGMAGSWHNLSGLATGSGERLGIHAFLLPFYTTILLSMVSS